MPNHFHLLLWQNRAAGGKRGRDSYSSGFDGFRGRPRARSGIKRVASPFPPLDVSSPASTVTVENTNSETATRSELDLTATATAGFADTAGISDANDLGDFDSYHAVHDGTSEPILDTSQGLISAVGGQDLNALEFVGAEVHVGVNGRQ
jgi:hypothetical protein